MGTEHTKAVDKARNVLANGARAVVSTQLLSNLLAAYDDLEQQYDRDVAEVIAEREAVEAVADRIAYAVAPVEVIGEHSSANNPWDNAVEHAAMLRATLLRYEQQIEDHVAVCTSTLATQETGS